MQIYIRMHTLGGEQRAQEVAVPEETNTQQMHLSTTNAKIK